MPHRVSLTVVGMVGFSLLTGFAPVRADHPGNGCETLLRPLSGIETDADATNPPAFPDADGHLVICAARSRVYLPPGAYAELAPSLQRIPAQFAPTDSYLLINDRLNGVDELPDGKRAFSRCINTIGRNGSSIKRYALGVINNSSQTRELMRCTALAADPGPRLAIRTENTGDATRIRIADRELFGAIYLFVHQRCLGRLSDSARIGLLDTRRISAGTYPVSLLAETRDGALLPVVRAKFTVPPHYTVDIPTGDAPIKIPFDQTDPALTIRVAAANGMDVAVTRVYLNGKCVGENEKRAFEMAIPLRDVPRGDAILKIVGVGGDGTEYAAETRRLRIENDTDGFYAAPHRD